MSCTTTTAMYLNVSTEICASASASRSGNTVTVSGTFTVTQGNSWNYNAIYAYVDGHTSWTRVKPYVQSGGTWYADFSFSFTDSGSGNPTYTAIFQVWNNAETGTVGGSASTTFSVSYPSGATAPTGLWANNLVRYQEGFSMNVYISGWGGAGDANSRYRELQCWTYSSSGLVEPRRWQPAYGDATSGTITVGNSSNGTLNIRGNTLYVLGLYASNGSYNTGSVRYDQATTLPYKDTLSVNKVWDTMADITYSVPSDGGRYDKTLQYSLDGTNWTTYDTISGGSAKSSSFILMNLTPNTSYTLRSRVTTNNAAYIVNNDNLTVTTLSAAPTITQEAATDTSVTIGYSFAADGGAYDKTIAYTVDGGAHWMQGATVTGGGAVAGNFTISDLQPGTSYNLIVRVTTGAGTITLDDMTISTLSDKCKIYGSVQKATGYSFSYSNLSDTNNIIGEGN